MPVALTLWPLPLEPRLPMTERRNHRLPAASSECSPQGGIDAAPLLILGIRDGAVLKRLPGQNSLDLRLTAQGGWANIGGSLTGNKLPSLSMTNHGCKPYQCPVAISLMY